MTQRLETRLPYQESAEDNTQDNERPGKCEPPPGSSTQKSNHGAECSQQFCPDPPSV